MGHAPLFIVTSCGVARHSEEELSSEQRIVILKTNCHLERLPSGRHVALFIFPKSHQQDPEQLLPGWSSYILVFRCEDAE